MIDDDDAEKRRCCETDARLGGNMSRYNKHPTPRIF